MNYIKKDLGSFGLHLINTDKFKTVTMKVVFHTPIIKKQITKRNILSDILIQSSKNYNSRRNLTIKAEDLYAADISTNNQRIGNYIMTSFILQVLNDKYTEENNLKEAIKFLSEILFCPDIEKKAFKKEKLDIVKNNAKVALNSIKEDSTSYSLIRMAEAYDKDSPISYRMTGYLEDLDEITEKNLYDHYLDMINNDYVDIFIVGSFNNEEIIKTVKQQFKFRKLKKPKQPYLLEGKKCRNRRLIAKETIENSQSKIAIACPIKNLTDYERNYSLVLANIIFGGGADSKLFKEVREKNSLCYTIHSFANRFDSLLVINAGIDKNNYDKTVELITKNLDNMKKGKFNNKEIDTAKEIYSTAAEELEESEQRIINEYLFEEILGIKPIKERVKIMNDVTKQEIVKVCKKINMDTIFLLEGIKNEEN